MVRLADDGGDDLNARVRLQRGGTRLDGVGFGACQEPHYAAESCIDM